MAAAVAAVPTIFYRSYLTTTAEITFDDLANFWYESYLKKTI